MPQGTPTFRGRKGKAEPAGEDQERNRQGSNKQPRRVCQGRGKDQLCQMLPTGQTTRGLKINPFDKKEDMFNSLVLFDVYLSRLLNQLQGWEEQGLCHVLLYPTPCTHHTPPTFPGVINPHPHPPLCWGLEVDLPAKGALGLIGSTRQVIASQI